jgi:hypothetical protein
VDLSSDQWPDEYKVDAENLADALVEVSGNYLRGKITAANNADIYQVIIHTTAGTLAGAAVSAETPGDPGDPTRTGRCHLEDGPGIDPGDAALIACDATTSVITHDADGGVLNVGQLPPRGPASPPLVVQRRRDQPDRPDEPGRHHHRLVHARGTPSPTPPPAPGSPGPLSDNGVTAATIQRAPGEPLDLHYATWAALHNGHIPRDPATRTFYNIEPPHQQAALWQTRVPEHQLVFLEQLRVPRCVPGQRTSGGGYGRLSPR